MVLAFTGLPLLFTPPPKKAFFTFSIYTHQGKNKSERKFFWCCSVVTVGGRGSMRRVITCDIFSSSLVRRDVYMRRRVFQNCLVLSGCVQACGPWRHLAEMSLLWMLNGWTIMWVVSEERFDFNGLSGLRGPASGGAGLCVIAEINRRSGRKQGCIDTSPMRYGGPPLGQGREAATVSRLLCIWRDFPSPPGSNSSAFLRFHVFPFSAFSRDVLETPSSRLLWCVSPSLCILRNWGIWWDLHNMKYSWLFWMAIKRLERASDCAEQLGMHHPPRVIYQHQPVDKSRLHIKWKISLMLQRLRIAREGTLWGIGMVYGKADTFLLHFALPADNMTFYWIALHAVVLRIRTGHAVPLLPLWKWGQVWSQCGIRAIYWPGRGYRCKSIQPWNANGPWA